MAHRIDRPAQLVGDRVDPDGGGGCDDEAKYKEALALAKRLGDGLERRDAYRSGQTRIEVP